MPEGEAGGRPAGVGWVGEGGGVRTVDKCSEEDPGGGMQCHVAACIHPSVCGGTRSSCQVISPDMRPTYKGQVRL